MLAEITEKASSLPFQNFVQKILQSGEQLRQPQLSQEKQKRIEQYNILNNQYQDSISDYIQKYPAQENAGLLSLQYFFDIRKDTSFLRKNLQVFQSANIANRYTAYIVDELNGLDSGQVGKMMPNFSLLNIKNSIEKYPNGKKTLFVFWASWCAPCRLETEHLKAQYQSIQQKGIELVSVNLDDDKNRWLLASKQDQIPWTNCFSDGAWESRMARFFTLHQIPQNVLIDGHGKIEARNISINQLLK